MSPGRVACLLAGLLASVLSLPGTAAAGTGGERILDAERLLLREGDPRGAIAVAEEVLVDARHAEDSGLESHALWLLSVAEQGLPDNERAMELALQSHAAALRAADPVREALAMDQVGNCLYAAARPIEALAWFEAARQRIRGSGDDYADAIITKDVGITLRTVGRYDDSLPVLREVAERFRRMEAWVETSSARANLGLAYAYLAEPARALAAYQDARLAAELAASPGDVADVRVRMGYLYLGVGRPREGLAELEEALACIRALPEPGSREVWPLMGIVSALEELGRRPEALAAHRELMEIATRQHDSYATADGHRDLGYLLLDDDPAGARREFDEALARGDELGLARNWDTHAGRARALALQGDRDGAIAGYARAVELLEEARRLMTSEQSRAAWSGQHQDAPRALVAALLARAADGGGDEDVVRAFEVLERHRGRALLDALGAPSSDAELRDAERAGRERALLAELRGLKGSAADGARSEEIQGELDRVASEIGPSAPGGSTAFGVREAREALAPGAAFVSYMAGRETLSSFVLTRDALSSGSVPLPLTTLQARIANLDELRALGDAASARAVSAALARDVLAPVLARLPPDVRSLVISPDGPLAELAFETLEDEGGRLLLEPYDVSYVPSATLLREIAARPPSRGSGVIVVAAPEARGGAGPAEDVRRRYEEEGFDLGALPGADAEARSLEASGVTRRVWSGRLATERRVKELARDSCRVLHVATHGLVSRRSPARSALLLAPDGADDGFLQAREIVELRLGCDLVVLSACRTARGRVIAGEGVSGLASAFLRAGARAVVATLGDVPDAVAAALMADLYAELGKGRSVAGALRAAKARRRQAGEGAEAWGAFIVIGDGAIRIPLGTPAPVASGPGTTAVVAAAILLLILAAGRLLFRSRP